MNTQLGLVKTLTDFKYGCLNDFDGYKLLTHFDFEI